MLFCGLDALLVPACAEACSSCRLQCMDCMQSLQKKVPHHFEVMNQRKGFVRYMSPDLRTLVKQHADALEDRETALTSILQVTLYLYVCPCMGRRLRHGCLQFLNIGFLHEHRFSSAENDHSLSAELRKRRWTA